MALRDWNRDGKKNFIDDLIEYDLIFGDDDDKESFASLSDYEDEDEDDFDDDFGDEDDDDNDDDDF